MTDAAQQSGQASGGGRPLPITDADAPFARRREEQRQATERRVQRERDLAVAAARWLGDDLVDGPIEFRQQFTVTAKLHRVRDLLVHLKDELGCAMLTDLTAIDYMQHDDPHPERFCVLWTVTNLDQNANLRIKAYVSEDTPLAPTVSDVWGAANWPEREVYDMYGIEFTGHPNLVRILMPLEYAGFPLRKDYPLRGRGERDNYPVIRRGEGEERE